MKKTGPFCGTCPSALNAARAVGLIGANGAGKSTVMKLMLGLLQGEGRILVDGTEVRRETLGEVRKKLGFVLQNSDNQMFMPTVYEDMIFAPPQLHGEPRGDRCPGGRRAGAAAP